MLPQSTRVFAALPCHPVILFLFLQPFHFVDGSEVALMCACVEGVRCDGCDGVFEESNAMTCAVDIIHISTKR